MPLGLEEFLNTFGDLTVMQVATFILIIVFMVAIYKKVKTYFVERYQIEEERDKNIKEALEQTRKYPEYRQQSIDIQHQLQSQMDALKESQDINTQRLIQLEEAINYRERNKIRGRLLEYYRYYTNPQRNPLCKWTEMEADAFWELFKDYEKLDGNGFMHSVVQPAMNKLIIVTMDDKDSITELMSSRK